MGVLTEYMRQWVEAHCQALMKPPFSLRYKDAMPLAVYLITGTHKNWNECFRTIVKLCPTASVTLQVLRKYYPHPHPLWETTNYKLWSRNTLKENLSHLGIYEQRKPKR